MDISFEKILETFKSPIKNPNFNQEVESQLDSEFIVIEEKSKVPNVIANNFGYFNISKLCHLVKKKYYNSKIMELTADIVKSRFIFCIHKYINNFVQIGEDSTCGNVMLASLGDVKNFLVLKISKTEDKNSEIFHEAFIGMCALNSLREFVPNFAYIYGTFISEPPFFSNDDKNILHWSYGTRKKFQFIAYENITPQKNLSEELKTCNSVRFFSWLIQIILALNVAYEKFKFTHYDLHCNNVILRVSDDQDHICHEYDDEKFYVKTFGEIATIIDYGYSYVCHDNKHYGCVNEFTEYGIKRDSSFLVHDIFKFLFTCSIQMIKFKNKTINDCIPILSYISKDYKQILRNSISFINYEPNISLSDITKFILYHTINHHPKVVVFRLWKKRIPNENINYKNAMLDIHKFNQFSYNDNFAEFIERFCLLKDEKKHKFLENFNFKKTLTIERAQLSQMMDAVTVYDIFFLRKKYPEIFNDQCLNEAKKFYDNCVTFFGNYKDIKFKYNLIKITRIIL